jgi:ribosomal protein L37AE/L43A
MKKIEERAGRPRLGPKKTLWICDECGLDFTTKHYLIIHQANKHYMEEIIST